MPTGKAILNTESIRQLHRGELVLYLYDVTFAKGNGANNTIKKVTAKFVTFEQ